VCEREQSCFEVSVRMSKKRGSENFRESSMWVYKCVSVLGSTDSL